MIDLLLWLRLLSGLAKNEAALTRFSLSVWLKRLLATALLSVTYVLLLTFCFFVSSYSGYGCTYDW